MTLGSDIRKMRLYRGFKLRQFAKMLDVSPSYLSQVERDYETPSAEVIKNISVLLGINPDITTLRAGKIPGWIKDLLASDQALFCVEALKEVHDGRYQRKIMQLPKTNQEKQNDRIR